MKFYIRYNSFNQSWSVFQAGRKNEFGEPYCVVPLVSEFEAQKCCESLNAGQDAWAWTRLTQQLGG